MRNRLALLATILALLTLLLGIDPIPVVSGPASWAGADFTYCFGVIESYWRGSIADPYSYESLRAVLRWRWGVETQVVMPLAYAPTALWILRPFDWMATFVDPALLWNFLSWGFFGAAILSVRPLTLRPLWLGVLLLLVSPASLDGLALGQSVHLGAALLVLMMQKGRKPILIAAQAVALFVLSMKPTYFILGVVLALLGQSLQAVLYGCGLTAFASLFAISGLPRGALQNWWHNLSFFSSASDARLMSFGTAKVFDRTLSFRNLLSSLCGSELSWKISRPLFLLVVCSWCFVSAYALKSRIAWSLQSRARAQAVVLASFLIFSTYLGSYEELLLVPMLIALGRVRATVTNVETFGVLLVLLPAFQLPLGIPALVALKIVGIVMLLKNSFEPSGNSSCIPQ